MEIGILALTVQLFSTGIAKSTQMSYKSGSKRYAVFCGKLTYFHSQCQKIILGLGDPNVLAMPQLEFIIKGLKQQRATGQNRMRLPISVEAILEIGD